MFPEMTERQWGEAFFDAIYRPHKLGALTPGEFCTRYGVPNLDQWLALRELLIFTVGGRIRSRCAVAA